jgi:hypothetical protein
VLIAYVVCYHAIMLERGETSLEMAVRHVAEARRIVAQQRERIARLKADGHSIVDHEKTLEVLEATLRIFEHDERRIRERMGIPK